MADTTLPGVLLDGDHASRPAANTVASGTLYACTTHDLIYQSDGSSWSTWADLTGSSGSVLTTQGDILYRDGSGLQRLAIGTASQVLTVNAGATAPEWAAGGGGGGGGTFLLDTSAEASGNARNDEFNSGPAIDAKWTLVGTTPDTVDVDSTADGKLHLRRNDTGGQLSVYYQNIPSTPFDIYLKVDASTFSANYCRGGGIVLLPSSPTTASGALYLGVLYNGGYTISGVIYSNLSTFGSTVFTSPTFTPGPHGAWLRITVSTTTSVNLSYSINGAFWSAGSTGTNPGFTIANAGIGLAPEGQALDLQALFDWYRVS